MQTMQREATQRGGCGCGMGTLQSAHYSCSQHINNHGIIIMTPHELELIIGCIQIRKIKTSKNTAFR